MLRPPTYCEAHSEAAAACLVDTYACGIWLKILGRIKTPKTN